MSRDGDQRDVDAKFAELTAPLERERLSRTDPLSAFDAADAELDARGDGFVPPDPQLRLAPQAVAPWVVLGLGLAAAVACLLLAPGPVRWVTGALSLLLVVAGAVLLVRRLPAERGDPGDNGARV
jgi:hypothetical protein